MFSGILFIAEKLCCIVLFVNMPEPFQFNSISQQAILRILGVRIWGLLLWQFPEVGQTVGCPAQLTLLLRVYFVFAGLLSLAFSFTSSDS